MTCGLCRSIELATFTEQQLSTQLAPVQAATP